MEFKNVIYTKDGGIATLRLNRPAKLNALSLETFAEIRSALGDAEEDAAVQVVIITGEGRAFSAGDDINDFAKAGKTPFSARSWAKKIHSAFMCVEKLAKPVIAAVNGLAYGGGCELVVACDIVIASEKATFALPEGRTGGYAGFSVHRLSSIVGTKKAMEILLTGDAVDAAEAWRIGLVNKVVPAEELEAEARKMAQRIMTCTPLAVSVCKSLVNKEHGGRDVEETLLGAPLLLMSGDFDHSLDANLKKLQA